MKYTINNNMIQFEQGNNQISVSIHELEHILQKTKVKDAISNERLCKDTGNLMNVCRTLVTSVVSKANPYLKNRQAFCLYRI